MPELTDPSLSAFTPVVRDWFRSRVGQPTAPQREGWPAIREGRHTLIAAPTGTGKTLTAFLHALDSLLAQPSLPDATQVLYVSPLKALGNDIQKNLERPLAELRAIDPSLPEVRVLVRTGDTTQAARESMLRRPPHILVTTPESLYLLLTTDRGRRLLATVRTCIVDEIHALARDKRGSHLALSLERLEALAPGFQRIGLSATQKPLSDTARFLVGFDAAGAQRPCTLVDTGHGRPLDLAIELPRSPLSAVMSGEVWEELYERISALIREHRTTIIFVNTRKMAERVAARLIDRLGTRGPNDEPPTSESAGVTSHHGSLSKERRLDAEERLKSGKLKALVATASLELGIDVGDVDLCIQVGSTRSIATFLQRVGRAGHAIGKVPKGRLFPLTMDELLEAAALFRAVRERELDRTPQPRAPLDILAQQVVAACIPEAWDEGALFDLVRRSAPYRDLSREDWDATVELHTGERRALLHRDGVQKRLRATRRARMIALMNGGAIGDTGDYRVVAEPDGTLVGSVNEDFGIELSQNDVFQLGTTSWRVLNVRQGTVRVADAGGAPATIPFWFGEAPGRTEELSRGIAVIRETAAGLLPAARAVPEVAAGPEAAAARVVAASGIDAASAGEIASYVAEGVRILGTVPTQTRVVAERFFDETGGMQLVIHAPFGARINRAWGLALRKRFCRSFGFELQAAANEEAIILSLGMQHSFPLEEVFDYLHPATARDVLVQALLPTPVFGARWRWNAQRALLLERLQKGKRVPAPIARARADDLLVQAFPQVLACFETLPPGDLPVPYDHPLVRQTIEDCLNEWMDVEGFLRLVAGLRDGSIQRVAVDTPEPSIFAAGIISSPVYTFLDDAPLEERRTHAVKNRRTLDPRSADDVGALDPEAIARVREQAWPQPRDAEEVHEALLWMGFATEGEVRRSGWEDWIRDLAAHGRVRLVAGRWLATEMPAASSQDLVEILRGRLEALGPVPDARTALGCGDQASAAACPWPEAWSALEGGSDPEPWLLELEQRGVVLRGRFEGRAGWCDRRLLARIHRETLDKLRKEIEPVTASQLLHFLADWQHVAPPGVAVAQDPRLEGPRGVADVVRQLAGFEVPAAAWESSVLPARVRAYRRDWLDELTLSGEVVWGRLWGESATPVRTTPICLFPREDLDAWMALAPAPDASPLSGTAQKLREILEQRGAVFTRDLLRLAQLPEAHLEMGLSELAARGLLTCDSYAGLRWLVLFKGSRSKLPTVGRWSLLPRSGPKPEKLPVEFVARQLLRRTGVVFRRTLGREKQPVPWRDLVRVLRTLEARGEIRGGRFVAGFDGEQYALPEALEKLRAIRRAPEREPASVSASDPLNFRGILTPDERVSPVARKRVAVG